jgi:hypothetical protein
VDLIFKVSVVKARYLHGRGNSISSKKFLDIAILPLVSQVIHPVDGCDLHKELFREYHRGENLECDFAGGFIHISRRIVIHRFAGILIGDNGGKLNPVGHHDPCRKAGGDGPPATANAIFKTPGGSKNIDGWTKGAKYFVVIFIGQPEITCPKITYTKFIGPGELVFSRVLSSMEYPIALGY